VLQDGASPYSNAAMKTEKGYQKTLQQQCKAVSQTLMSARSVRLPPEPAVRSPQMLVRKPAREFF